MGESRRTFLKKFVLAAEPAVKAPAEQTLVCVFLRGGADTLNMIVPYADKQYYKVRPSIAIPPPSSAKNASLKLDDFYSLHPKLADLLPIFAAGELGIVQAVGSDNPTGSHFEAQDQMEHGESYGRTIGGGWLGRYLRTRSIEALTPLSAVAIGEVVPESFRSAPVTSVIRKIEEINMTVPSGCTDALCKSLSAMYGGAQAGLLSSAGKSTLDLLKRVDKLRSKTYLPSNGAVYSDDAFSAGLKEVARLVKAGVGLEVACVDIGGWDTHFVQGGQEGLQATLIQQLGNGLSAFWKDLGSYNKKVSTIVMTEFGRRIYENGSLGTDHGRGFAFMAIGAGVNGGKIYGRYPGLQDDQYDLGPGGLKITCDYRSVLSELLSWRGADLESIFPGYVAEPVGLMKLKDSIS